MSERTVKFCKCDCCDVEVEDTALSGWESVTVSNSSRDAVFFDLCNDCKQDENKLAEMLVQAYRGAVGKKTRTTPLASSTSIREIRPGGGRKRP